MSASSSLTIESVEQKVLGSMEFQSMSVDGESTSNVSPLSLMKVRSELMAEEEREKKGTWATFDLSDQGY